MQKGFVVRRVATIGFQILTDVAMVGRVAMVMCGFPQVRAVRRTEALTGMFKRQEVVMLMFILVGRLDDCLRKNGGA
jgi:hypothetical protein